MKNVLRFFYIFIGFSLFFGCNSQTPQIKEVALPLMPDFQILGAAISKNLDKSKMEYMPLETLKSKTEEIRLTLAACEKAEKAEDCETVTEANLNLMLGDIYLFQKDYKPAQKHYIRGIELRRILVKFYTNQYEKFKKINANERKTKGDTPLLNIGAHFIDSKFYSTFFVEYCEITRFERRMGEALKEEKDMENAQAILAKAQSTFHKAMEYRKKYEISKRELLKQKGFFKGDFSNYDAYIKKWDSNLIVKKI